MQPITDIDMVYALAATPPNRQGNIICFAARSSGLYRSEDRGRTWQYALDSLNLDDTLGTLAVAVSPQFSVDNTVYAGAPGGVLRSTDGGQTWQAAMLPAPPPIVSSIAISPNYAEDGTVFVGTIEDGLFCSVDRGDQWASWNFGLLDLAVIDVAISPNYAKDKTLFVGTESGIFYSKNGGKAWQVIDFPMDYAPVISLAISPDFAGNETLFAGTEANGLYRSTDKGVTWHQLAATDIVGAVNAIVLTPTMPDMLVLTENAVLVSEDQGLSWKHWHTNASIQHDLLAGEGSTALAVLDQGLSTRQLLIATVKGDIHSYGTA